MPAEKSHGISVFIGSLNQGQNLKLLSPANFGGSLMLFIMVDFPIHIDTISMDLSILYFKGSQVKNSKILHISVSQQTVDPTEMSGLHCLLKYLFTGIQNEKSILQ